MNNHFFIKTTKYLLFLIFYLIIHSFILQHAYGDTVPPTEKLKLGEEMPDEEHYPKFDTLETVDQCPYHSEVKKNEALPEEYETYTDCVYVVKDLEPVCVDVFDYLAASSTISSNSNFLSTHFRYQDLSYNNFLTTIDSPLHQDRINSILYGELALAMWYNSFCKK